MDVVEDGSDAFLFMHACQSPQFVLFLKLRCVVPSIEVDLLSDDERIAAWNKMDLH